MKEPGDKLSRRYFASLLGLGAVAAAMGVHAVVEAREVVAEKAEGLKMQFNGKWRVVHMAVTDVKLVAGDTLSAVAMITGFVK